MHIFRKWTAKRKYRYRALMLKLSKQITPDDLRDLKYMLTDIIPDGIKETLPTAIELFRHLEKLRFVQESNLQDVKELFRDMERFSLCQMITNFVRDREINEQLNQGDKRTVESLTESQSRMLKTDAIVSDLDQMT